MNKTFTLIVSAVLYILCGCSGADVSKSVSPTPPPPPSQTPPNDSNPVPCCFWIGSFDSVHVKVGEPYDFAAHAVVYVENLQGVVNETDGVHPIIGAHLQNHWALDAGCTIDTDHPTVITCTNVQDGAAFMLNQTSYDGNNLQNPEWRFVVVVVIDP